MIDPAKPFSTRPSQGRTSAAATKADLSGLLDRARDERFRLLKMLRDARAEVAVTVEKSKPTENTQAGSPAAPPRVIEADAQPSTTHAPPAIPATAPGVDPTQLKDLVAKLSTLDTQLDAKLRRVESLTDGKIDRLEQIDARITSNVQKLTQTLSDGRDLHQDLTNATQYATGLPARVIEQLERFDQHVASAQSAEQSAFDQQLAHLKQRLLGDVATELGGQRAKLDAELADAHATAEREIVQRFDQLADSLHDRADDILAKTETAANQAMRRIRKQVVDAMARAHDTQTAFKSKLDEHQGQHREFLADLTDTADREMQDQAERLDASMTGLAELFESQADQILTELRDRATTLLDQMANAAAKLQSEATDRDDGLDRRAA